MKEEPPAFDAGECQLSIFVQQTSLLGNGTSGGGMIACNHDHADSCIATAIYGCTYCGA